MLILIRLLLEDRLSVVVEFEVILMMRNQRGIVSDLIWSVSEQRVFERVEGSKRMVLEWVEYGFVRQSRLLCVYLVQELPLVYPSYLTLSSVYVVQYYSPQVHYPSAAFESY
jgi:hypothetical protein